MILAGCSENSTGSAVFLLSGFNSIPALQPLIFVFFTTIYLFTVAGNILVPATVAADARLQSPMFFFLGYLSVLEICCTSSIIPTLLGSHLGQGIRIPLSGCIVQFSVYAWFSATECFLLAVMAYDRYVAICHPLRYFTLMNQQLCLHLTLCTWVVGFIISMTNSIFLWMLQFPDHSQLDHFMCDLLPLVNGACSDTSQIKMEVFLSCFVVLSIPFMLLIVSYVHIILTILRIPSTKGKNKAFSTCSSHLIIVIAYFGILILMYMVPSIGKTHNSNKAFSLLYTVGTPLFNPIVYTLRNKEMRDALKIHVSQNGLLLLTWFSSSEKVLPHILKGAKIGLHSESENTERS